MTARWWLGVAARLAVRPGLWGTAVVALVRLAPRGWWRRFPPLPRPDPAYLRFRLQTYSGDPDRPPDPAELLAWLRWVRAWSRLPAG